VKWHACELIRIGRINYTIRIFHFGLKNAHAEF
jgi:hypothetical protein